MFTEHTALEVLDAAPLPAGPTRTRRSPAGVPVPTPTPAPVTPARAGSASAGAAPLPAGLVPAPAARLGEDVRAPELTRPSGPARPAASPTGRPDDREALIDEVVSRLQREARLDRERLGLAIEDLL
jgi:hypothetical protein